LLCDPIHNFQNFLEAAANACGLGAGAGDCDRLGRPADELPHAPFMAGELMRRAIGFLDAAGQLAMRLFGQTP
jgi:hypothetical protein